MTSADDLTAAAAAADLALEQLTDLAVSDSELIEALERGGRRVIPSAQGFVSVVEETFSLTDFSATTRKFDMHNDGLYLDALPPYVMLYCEEPGRGDTPTVFCDAIAAARRLLESDRADLFRRLSIVYIGRKLQEHESSLIQEHPQTGDPVLVLGSRAYLRARSSLPPEEIPTLREISSALRDIYEVVDEASICTKDWSNGDAVLFDNYKFLHARVGSRADTGRRLKRIWFG